jgi:hypothetical protein
MIQLEVLAGKMSFDGKKVSPDPRKGLLRVVIDAAADKVEVQWLDRSMEPPVVEDRWASPVTIEAVPSAKTGKVYVLKSEVGEKQFVWIQQKNEEEAGGFAASQVDSLEALINQIQMFAQMRSGKDAAEMHSQIFGAGGEDEQLGDDQMLLDLGHHHHDDGEGGDEIDMEELMEHLMSSENVEDVNQLAVLLLMQPEIQQDVIAYLVLLAANYLQAQGGLTLNSNPQPQSVTPVEVSSVIHAPQALSVYQENDVREKLLALCPSGESDIVSVIRSPQLGEALRSLTEGVYSEQIALLFTSLGLDPSGIQGDPFEALCRALERKHGRQ